VKNSARNTWVTVSADGEALVSQAGAVCCGRRSG
jgi:hypothetical protein